MHAAVGCREAIPSLLGKCIFPLLYRGQDSDGCESPCHGSWGCCLFLVQTAPCGSPCSSPRLLLPFSRVLCFPLPLPHLSPATPPFSSKSCQPPEPLAEACTNFFARGSMRTKKFFQHEDFEGSRAYFTGKPQVGHAFCNKAHSGNCSEFHRGCRGMSGGGGGEGTMSTESPAFWRPQGRPATVRTGRPAQQHQMALE